ncbi:MAG: hypothetical protein VST72_03415 [Nitrospirota bacterium]|nr:hypothetical protein [Nitrospirota bacterium]
MDKPLIIGIGGTNSGVGKTTVAAAVLQYLTGNKRWGAIKYTVTSSSSWSSIVADKTILMEEGKDTSKMLNAGASDVLWVKAPRSGSDKVLPEAVKRLSCLDGIIVEGNSAIEFLKPAVVIFIIGDKKKLWKSGVERFAAIADILLYENGPEIPETGGRTKLFSKRFSEKEEYKGVLERISGLLNEKAERRIE